MKISTSLPFFALLWISISCTSKPADLEESTSLPDRPNIIWIVAEDLSPQHLGVYGGTGGGDTFSGRLS